MHTNESLVSVIISAYNHEKYVQETIQSIINQTYQNIELIVIDDGSTDSTWQKIKEIEDICEKRFKRVYFESQQNIGCALTLNKLIEQSNGEYLYFIASDDIAKSRAIEIQVNFLNNNPEYCLVVGNNEIIDFEGKLCYWDKNRNIVYDKKHAKYKTFVDSLSEKNSYFNDDIFGTYETLYIQNYIPNGYLIRSTVLQKVGKLSKDILEDWFIMLQLSKYAKFKYINEVLFSYRWHDNNTIKKINLINVYAKNVREREEKILKKISKSSLSLMQPSVINTHKCGALYKRQGIPFIVELLTYRKDGGKFKTYKLFGMKIFSYYKNDNKNGR